MSNKRAFPSVEVREEDPGTLGDYASVSIAFQVDRVLEPEPQGNGLSGIALRERPVERWLKDYDTAPGSHPLDWERLFDLSRWGVLAAYSGGRRVGGAAIAYRTDGLDLLEHRSDLAVLFDLRVAPEARGRGVGSALFRRSEAWARERGCVQLKVETQNVNVSACEFYRSRGCELGAIHRFAYPDLPDEIQLLWYRDL